MRKVNIEYVPPSQDVLYRFAATVGERLAASCANPSYTDPDVVSGLASFLHAVAEIQARMLNDGILFDKTLE